MHDYFYEVPLFRLSHFDYVTFQKQTDEMKVYSINKTKKNVQYLIFLQ